MPKALEYASHIIHETKRFMDFAIALADYMGEDFIPYSKSVYAMLRSLPHDNNVVFESAEAVERYNSDFITQQFRKYRAEQEQKQRKQEFKENIDELQFLVKNYRSCEAFKKMLDFIGKFNYLAPYNAMLVQMQKPGATFVFNGKKWAEYGRRPTINAQKLIILKPFGPIQCIFDYSDTEPIPGVKDVINDAMLMEEWDKSLMKTSGQIPQQVMDLLYNNLITYGIYLDETTLLAANTYGGYIMPYTNKKLIVKLNSECYLETNSKFIISINRKQENAVKFHTICHELGHLFCRHQSYDSSKRRSLTLKEREFEAETVAWLVCKRRGIKNPSEEYLAGYAPYGEIPICSQDTIMRAVTEIEKMLKGEVNIKDSLWYKEDKVFKKKVSDKIQANKF